MTIFHKQAEPFTYVSKMPMFKVKCYRCGQEIVQAVDWGRMLGVYHPRQLVACGDCIQIFMRDKLPGMADAVHRSMGELFTKEAVWQLGF